MTRISAVFILSLLFIQSIEASSLKHSFKGVSEVSISQGDTLDSYLTGDYGKFRYDDGFNLSLSQLGLQYQLDFNDYLSANIIANGYSDNGPSGIGITEAYLKYKGLPSDNGLQTQVKAGIIYPHISIENNATAWSSPNFVNYSTLNTWIGEELRHVGLEADFKLLGKYRQSDHDLSINLSAFKGNDTTGALLSWHGWTMSNRQTLWQETVPVTPFPARISGDLVGQAAESDPFIELDDRFGAMVNLQWSWQKKIEATIGYYDNNADTLVVENGQYAWGTKFTHGSLKWRLGSGYQVQAQFMHGSTQMNSPTGKVVVQADFQSGFVSLIKRYQKHNFALRAEEFYLRDGDTIEGDNNDEYGKALTLSYRYQINKGWFTFIEHNWVNSYRPSRYYLHHPRKLIEQQWQLAFRYYF